MHVVRNLVHFTCKPLKSSENCYCSLKLVPCCINQWKWIIHTVFEFIISIILYILHIPWQFTLQNSFPFHLHPDFHKITWTGNILGCCTRQHSTGDRLPGREGQELHIAISTKTSKAVLLYYNLWSLAGNRVDYFVSLTTKDTFHFHLF